MSTFCVKCIYISSESQVKNNFKLNFAMGPNHTFISTRKQKIGESHQRT